MKTTNNKLMSDVMQANLGLLPLIMDNIPQAVFWKDRNLVYLGCNRAFADDAGFSSPEDVIGKTDYDMPWKTQAELYRADDRAVMEKGEPKINYEEPQTTPGGSTIWLSTSKIPVHENGQVVAVLGMYEDITARKQVEADLLLRDRALASSLNAVIIVNISDNKPIYVNDALLKMTGHTREEVMQIGLSDITGNAEESKKIRAAIQTQGFFVGEELLKRKDGSVFPANFFSSLIIGAEGRPVAVQSTFFDITDRRKAEETIHESEERFRRFTEATVEGLVFHEQGKIIDVNPAALAMFSLSDSKELIGRNLLEFIVPESHKMVLQQMQLETVLPYEIQCVRSDGTIFPVETSTRIYKAGDRIIRASSIRDITERKRLEEGLLLRDRALASSLNAVLIVGLDFKPIYVNESFIKMTGYTYEEAIQLTVMDLNANPEGLKQIDEATHRQGFFIGEEYIKRKDGSIFPTDFFTSYINDDKGKPIAMQTAFTDATERKRLEAQVQQALERRGYQVQVSTEISQEVSAAPKLDELFERVVTLTKERLGYYHTQLLRYDPVQDSVVLINGYGETGKKMLEGGHKMPMGSGLIGTAAATGETLMRPTLAEDLTWQPNPLLPDTKGEIAVPIKWQDNILGVLDVQSDKAGSLTEDDRLLLEGLCGQIAIAIHSAELVETIRQNEARLAEALKIARLGNWEYDFENDLFHFTDEFYSIFHTTAEKVGGYKISSADYAKHFVHPDDAPLVGTEIQKVLDAKDRLFTTNLEHRIIFADGEVGYISVNINVERDENGKITRWYGANQDITERKQAEAALQRSEQLMRTVIDSTPDWIFIKDQDHRYQLANKGYADALHIAPEDFIGKNDLDLGFPEELVKGNPEKGIRGFWTDDRLVMDNNETQVYPDDPATIDGVVHSFHTIKIPLRDSDGNAWGVLAFARDITERKQAEARLAEALRAARLAHWEYDVEKDIFTFNDQFYSIFHTTAEKVGGYQLSSARYAELFVHPDDMEVVGKEIGKALSSTERVYNTSIDHRILYADGGVGYITVQLTVERDENGKITRYYGANQDITERRKAQEELAERLEEINRLYQNLSHEGWKTYRETADLPSGFVFDQTGVKPVEGLEFATDRFANIPMKVLGGEVVGNLAIADDPQRPISEDDFDFLQQVSEQIALALEGARLAAQTQSALAQTEKLSEAGLRFARSADLQELLVVFNETLGIPKISRVSIGVFEYNSAGDVDSMTIVANWWGGIGHKVVEIGMRYTPEMLHAMSLFLSPDPVFINDTFNDDRLRDVKGIMEQQQVHAIAVMPLYSGTRHIGALLLESDEMHNFTQDEIRLVSAMAPQISTALENRIQYERAQKQAEREGKLNIISQKIQSATSVEAVLQIAARELGHALGAPMTIAQLSMKDKK
ncbi:MAG: PAS domain S-box protein [Chloroflexi bacterium]|nr:PAS domain S-box protein [Chloroflexota bacterium]